MRAEDGCHWVYICAGHAIDDVSESEGGDDRGQRMRHRRPIASRCGEARCLALAPGPFTVWTLPYLEDFRSVLLVV